MKDGLNIIDNLEGEGLTLLDSRIEDIGVIIARSLRAANRNEYTYKTEIWDALLSEMSTSERIRQKTIGAYTVLYVRDEIVVGYGRLEKDDLEVDGGVLPDVWQSKNLHVDPGVQHQGIGKILVTERERKARSMGVEKLYLESWVFPDTLQFHENNGYQKIGENPREYMGQTLLTHVMEKPLR